MTMLVQCFSTRGLDVVASFNISNTLANMFNASFISMGAAIGIIVGNQLGAGEIEQAKLSSSRMTVFSLLICIITGCVMALVAGVFPKIYNTTDGIKSLATQLIVVASCMMPIQSLTNSCYFTIRAGGKTFVTFLFDSLFVWVISVPVAFCLSRFTSLGVVVMYLIVGLLDLIKVAIGLAMMASGVWCTNMTKSNQPPREKISLQK